MIKTIRINKYLAELGIGSRRKIDQLIRLGEINVNEKKAVLGHKIIPGDEVTVQGKIIKPTKVKKLIYALNKPIGYISTVSDELNRRTVTSLIKSNEKLFPVGRLDKNSVGLILLTNNGELAYRLTHPGFEIEKEYEVKTNSLINDSKIAKLISGLKYRGIYYQADKIEKMGFNKYLVVLHEGKNREIRKMLSAVGVEVMELKRTRIGKLILGDLKSGEYKVVSETDLF